jgi:hypothetical protein
MFRFTAVALLTLAGAARAGAPAPAENARIDYLLGVVASLPLTTCAPSCALLARV